MGESRNKDGFFGPYTEHLDDDGNKIGESREREGFFGTYVEHTDNKGNKTGESREKEGFFGHYTEHTDQDHSKVGESRQREGFFGPYTEHSDAQGNRTGESRRREGFFGAYTEHTGHVHPDLEEQDEEYDNYEWESSGRRTSYSGSSSSGEGWWVVPLVGLCVGLAIVIAIIWLAVFVVIPVAVLNAAVILTILALVRKNQRILFSAFAVVGGLYLLVDVGLGLLSTLFVDNVVKDRVWLTAFTYLNTVAVGVSSWLLVQPLWRESIALKDADQQKSMIMMAGTIMLVLAPVLGLPLIYHYLPVPVIPTETRVSTSSNRSGSPQNAQRQSAFDRSTSTSTASNSNVGQFGTFLTNVNLRSCPDRTCDSLGEHFKNARFRISETLNKDGIFWYKIEITDQGCHALNSNWCGKKLLRDRKNQAEVNRSYFLDGDDNAADSGWINSYNKDLSVYTVRLD